MRRKPFVKRNEGARGKREWNLAGGEAREGPVRQRGQHGPRANCGCYGHIPWRRRVKRAGIWKKKIDESRECRMGRVRNQK